MTDEEKRRYRKLQDRLDYWKMAKDDAGSVGVRSLCRQMIAQYEDAMRKMEADDRGDRSEA